MMKPMEIFVFLAFMVFIVLLPVTAIWMRDHE